MHLSKRSLGVGAIAAVGALTAIVVVGTGADAQSVPDIVITPSEPQPGGTITVTGECFGINPENGEKDVGTSVDVMLLDHEVPSQVEALEEFLQKATVVPEPDTTFSATLPVPPDAAPLQQFFVYAYCLHPHNFNFQSGKFGVGLPSSSTSTTAPPAGGGDGGGGDAGGGAPSGTGTGPTGGTGGTTTGGGRGTSAPPVSGGPTFTG